MHDSHPDIDDEIVLDGLAALANDDCDWCGTPRRDAGTETCAHCPICHEHHWAGCEHVVALVFAEHEGVHLLGEEFATPTLPRGTAYSVEQVRLALGELESVADAYDHGFHTMANPVTFVERLMELSSGVTGWYVGAMGSPVETVYFAVTDEAAEQLTQWLSDLDACFARLCADDAMTA